MIRTCPVHEGQELDAKISELSQFKKEGIVRVDGFVVFVPNTQPGQNVRIRITKIMSRAAEAELVG